MTTIIDTPLFVFAKTMKTLPSVTPTWTRQTAVLQPSLKVLERSNRTDYQGLCLEPPTSIEWWRKELDWMRNRNLVADLVPNNLPIDPLAYTPPTEVQARSTRRSLKVMNYPRTYLNDARSYGQENAPLDGPYVYTSSLRDCAALVEGPPLPFLFLDELCRADDLRALTNSKGQVYAPEGVRGESSPLQVFTDIAVVTSAAVQAAYELKWIHGLARPEEVFARLTLDADARTELQHPPAQDLVLAYPYGADACPSYPSVWAAMSGASAYVLARAADFDATSPYYNRAVWLAETAAGSRWVAGVSWQCDIIAGLHLGWSIAHMLLASTAPGTSPWEHLTTTWYE